MSQESRKEPRFPIAATVPLVHAGATLACAASDISSHGIFLEMPKPLPVDTFVKIGPAASLVPARVVFVLGVDQAQGIGRSPGVGLQLVEPIDPDTFLLSCAEDAAARRAAAVPEPLPGFSSGFSGPRTPAPVLEPPPRTPAPIAVGLPGQPIAPAAVKPAARAAVAAPAMGSARRRIVDVAPGAAPRAADAPLEVVTIDDGSPAHATVTRALVADGYTALAARHAFEALAFLLRRAPALAIVPEAPGGMPGRLLVEEARRRPELDGTAFVLVDAGDAPVPHGVSRWREVPGDVARVRAAIDRVLAEVEPQRVARPGGPTPGADARALAEAIAAIGHGLEDRGLLDEAAGALRYAGELAPTVAAHALRLARLSLARGGKARVDEAGALVERVLRLEPLAADALILRALVLDERGNKDGARAALKRAALLAPRHDEIAALDARLDKGLPLVERAADTAAEGEAAHKAGAPRGTLGRLKRMFGG